MGHKVIAIGNILMRDDAVGIHIAKELENYFITRSIELIIGETDVEYCLHCINDEDNLIILDAAFTEGEIGSVNVYPIEKLCSTKGEGLTQHHPSLIEAIALYKREIKGILITIGVYDISFEIGLSESIRELLPYGIEEVKKNIEVYIGGKGLDDIFG